MGTAPVSVRPERPSIVRSTFTSYVPAVGVAESVTLNAHENFPAFVGVPDSFGVTFDPTALEGVSDSPRSSSVVAPQSRA